MNSHIPGLLNCAKNISLRVNGKLSMNNKEMSAKLVFPGCCFPLITQKFEHCSWFAWSFCLQTKQVKSPVNPQQPTVHKRVSPLECNHWRYGFRVALLKLSWCPSHTGLLHNYLISFQFGWNGKLVWMQVKQVPGPLFQQVCWLSLCLVLNQWLYFSDLKWRKWTSKVLAMVELSRILPLFLGYILPQVSKVVWRLWSWFGISSLSGVFLVAAYTLISKAEMQKDCLLNLDF